MTRAPAEGSVRTAPTVQGATSTKARDWTVLELPMHDPRVRPLLDELAVEYDTRYGALFGHAAAAEELNRYPAEAFTAPGGALLIVQEGGESIAGGAFKRLDAETTEFKRIWTHSAHRRRGLGRFVLARLEALAADRGYRKVYLTTGPRQPEAKHLYLNTGYQPQFDTDADPDTIGALAFTKDLRPNPGYHVPPLNQ